MKYRKLRIAWSVVWGLAAVLLIVLWVRSYWWQDTVYRPSSNAEIFSQHGVLRLSKIGHSTSTWDIIESQRVTQLYSIQALFAFRIQPSNVFAILRYPLCISLDTV